MPNEQKVQNIKMAAISVCLYMCMCLCVSISLCVFVCDVPNIKLVSLAFMPNESKSEKYKNGMSLCVHVSVCICISVCVVCHL